MQRQIEHATKPNIETQKRVVFTKGGKGGVGKTGFMVNLAEWFIENEIPFTLLDSIPENKARGSLKHYFQTTARKVNIHTEAGLDAFVRLSFRRPSPRGPRRHGCWLGGRCAQVVRDNVVPAWRNRNFSYRHRLDYV